MRTRSFPLLLTGRRLTISCPFSNAKCSRWTWHILLRVEKKSLEGLMVGAISVGRDLQAGTGGGNAEPGRGRDRPDEDDGTGETSTGALGKDPNEAADGN